MLYKTLYHLKKPEKKKKTKNRSQTYKKKNGFRVERSFTLSFSHSLTTTLEMRPRGTGKTLSTENNISPVCHQDEST